MGWAILEYAVIFAAVVTLGKLCNIAWDLFTRKED